MNRLKNFNPYLKFFLIKENLGFSMIELLLALVLFSIAFLGLSKLLSTVCSLSKQSEFSIKKTEEEANHFEAGLVFLEGDFVFFIPGLSNL